MMTDWRDPAYLLAGGDRQRAAYRALHDLRLFEDFDAFDPHLAGTVPLGIDLPDSDLDVICEVREPVAFEALLRESFGDYPNFQLKHKMIDGLPTVVARFRFADFPIEVFGQPRPVREQRAFRHMLMEARLLALGGDPARRGIRSLKAAGLKTEPAFGRYFNLPGDPYQTLLDMEALDREALRKVITGFMDR